MAGKARDLLVRFLGDDTDLRKTTKGAADDVENTLGKVEAKADSPKLGGLKGKLGSVFDDLIGRTPAAGQALDVMGLKGDDLAGKLGGGIAQGAALGGAAVAAFVADGVGDLLKMSKEAESLATTMGGGTEAASRWIEVLRPLGVELGDVQDIFGNMAQLVQANDAVFSQLGVTIARNADGTADMNETLIRSIEALGQVKDGATRAAIAQKLFGEQGSRQFTPLIGNSEQLRSSLAGVADAFVITGEKAKAAAAVREDFKQFSQDARELQLELATAVLPIVQKLTGGIRELKDGLAEVSPTGKTGFGDVALAAADVTDPLNAAGKAVDLVTASWNDFTDSITHGRAEAARAAQQQQDLAAQVNKNRQEHLDLIDTLGTGTAATRNASRAQQEKTDLAKLDADATADAKQEAARFTQVLDAQAKAQDRARQSFEEHIGAVRSAFDGQAAFREAERQLAEATEAAAEAVDKATKKKMRDSDLNVDAGRKLDDLKAKVLDTATAYGTQNGALDGSREAVDRQKAKLAELRDQFRDRIPEITGFVDDYIKQLERAERAAALAAKAVNGFEVTASQINGGRKGPLDQRASGGPVRAGTPYIVGEEGEELFVPAQSGTIIPNDVLTRSTSGAPLLAGGGTTIIVNVAGTVWHLEELVDAITPAIQRRMRFTNGQVFSPV